MDSSCTAVGRLQIQTERSSSSQTQGQLDSSRTRMHYDAPLLFLFLLCLPDVHPISSTAWISSGMRPRDSKLLCQMQPGRAARTPQAQ